VLRAQGAKRRITFRHDLRHGRGDLLGAVAESGCRDPCPVVLQETRFDSAMQSPQRCRAAAKMKVAAWARRGQRDVT
jgi:hypothetical protein